MFKKNQLIYVSDDVLSEPAESRWFKHITKAKSTPGYRFLSHFSTVISAVNGCEFLVIEIITPYGEDLDDYTLSEYLSKNFPEKNFDNVTPLFISTHDSNAGTHHRVILIHSEQQKRSPLSFQDFGVPVEMFAVGLAEELSKKGTQTAITVVKFDNALIIVVYTGGMISYFIKEPFVSLEHAQERVERVVAFLKKDAFHKEHGPWRVYLFQESLKDLALEGVTIDRNLVMSITDLIKKGLTAIAESPLAETLNILPPTEIERRNSIRNGLALFKIVQVTLLLGVLTYGALFGLQYTLNSERDMLRQQSKVYTRQLHQLDSAQFDAQKLLAQAESQKKQMLFGVSWRIILNELAAALPKGGTVQTVRVDTKVTIQFLSFKVMVPNWDALVLFEEALEKNAHFNKVSISSKKKTKQDKVIAAVNLEVQ